MKQIKAEAESINTKTMVQATDAEIFAADLFLCPLLFDGGEMSTGDGGEMSTGDGGIPANAGTGSRRRGLPEKKGYSSYR